MVLLASSTNKKTNTLTSWSSPGALESPGKTVVPAPWRGLHAIGDEAPFSGEWRLDLV